MRFSELLSGSLTVLLLLLATTFAGAQGAVPVAMLSDIHFDPFHNPHLLGQLRAAPIGQWPAILNNAPTLIEDADSRAIQLRCRSRALDTSWDLLQTTLAAARQAQPHPVFVTLSGDLLTHQFPCRFYRLAPSASSADLEAFAAKTVTFVIQQLRQAFPGVPVYAALGNNDSGCADYQETPGDTFLQTAERAIVAAAEQGGKGKAGKRKGRLELSAEGDYSVALPAPLERGRLLVLEDLYESWQYRTCADKGDRTEETAQIAWLRAQLAEARSHREQVWVMGHIPPGVDVYTSFFQYLFEPGKMCSVQPRNFLASSALADALLDYPDVVRLGLFAHTHMDEIRLLHRAARDGAGVKAGSPEASVPLKLVPSVTTYFGNHPAFLEATVDPHSMVLKDWETYVSPTEEGAGPPWPAAYRFTAAYGLPDFSANSAQQLADGLAADRRGRSTRSTMYRDHFFAGGGGLSALGLEQIWPAYACAVRETEHEAFHQCLCPP